MCIIVQTQARQCSMSKKHPEYSQDRWHDQNYLSWFKAQQPKTISFFLSGFYYKHFDWDDLFLHFWPNWISRNESDASSNFQLWVASSSTKSKASSLVTQSTWDTCAWLVKALQEIKRKSHLIPELHSIEFAGMFKQFRPDNECESSVLTHIHIHIM